MKTFYRNILIILFVSAISPYIFADDNQAAPADQQVSACISNLGSETFEIREESQAKLLDIGKTQSDLVLKKSMEAYVGSKDPEARMRLKSIIRTIVTERNFHKKSFIGISMSNSPAQIKVGQELFTPIDIVNVVPDYPAEKAGFNNGDRILKIDDKVCDGTFGSNEAVEHISTKKPGTKVTFLLQSGEETVTKEVVTTERPDLPGEPSSDQQKEDFFNKWFKESLKSQDKQQSEKTAK